uniref:Molybdopterin cofactor sulfurase n=1 Tax=Rhizophora mucronata TaxID=61149 RepID=A0A2P2NRA2_RHIMU
MNPRDLSLCIQVLGPHFYCSQYSWIGWILIVFPTLQFPVLSVLFYSLESYKVQIFGSRMYSLQQLLYLLLLIPRNIEVFLKVGQA